MEETISITKRKLFFIFGLIIAIFSLLFFSPFQSGNLKEASALEVKFNQLNNAKTNVCAGPAILDNLKGDRLQGACCGSMDFHRYKEQLDGLKKYSEIDKIPADPYDIPRSLADELLTFQKTIMLTAEQQKVYDEAVKLSHEGGPCCCKCWRWYAFEGLAKYLITEKNFNAEQIAEVWDLEDGCGGPSHAVEHGQNE